jgi:hypothetical protein
MSGSLVGKSEEKRQLRENGEDVEGIRLAQGGIQWWAPWLSIFSMALPAHSGPRLLIQFRNQFSQTLGLLG